MSDRQAFLLFTFVSGVILLESFVAMSAPLLISSSALAPFPGRLFDPRQLPLMQPGVK
jgi:hypothetical protein